LADFCLAIAVGLEDADFPELPSDLTTEIPAEWITGEKKKEEKGKDREEKGKEKEKTEGGPKLSSGIKIDTSFLNDSLEDAFGADFGFEQIAKAPAPKRSAGDAFPFTTRVTKKCALLSESLIPPLPARPYYFSFLPGSARIRVVFASLSSVKAMKWIPHRALPSSSPKCTRPMSSTLSSCCSRFLLCLTFHSQEREASSAAPGTRQGAGIAAPGAR